MGVRVLASSRGFTYSAALVAVMIMGIMLGVAGQSWQTVMKREREEELLFRGLQYKYAFDLWYKPRPGQPPPHPIRDLKDLLKNPYSLTTARYLRRLYKDPVTDKEWEPIRDPVRGIIGVRSSSDDEPLKKGNFPEEIKEFEGKTKYSDWRFGNKLPPAAGTVTLPGIPAGP